MNVSWLYRHRPLRILGTITRWVLVAAACLAAPGLAAIPWQNLDAVSWSRAAHAESSGTAATRNKEKQRAPSQSSLLKAAIARLAPQVQGKTDVYVLALAGWSEQDVFIKELEGAFDPIDDTVPIERHVVRLVNHEDTISKVPLATRRNFFDAVHALAQVMDKEEDILLLFVTSHGSPEGVALRFPGKVNATLAPQDIAAAFDREGIKNRIVIVSACYSGVFVKPLANDDSLVLTAADDKSSSFGCSNEREWTYFGDAFFNKSLRFDRDFERAFEAAKRLIGEWEARERLPPSHPQGHFGAALMDKLKPIYKASGR